MTAKVFADDREREPLCAFCQRRKSEVSTLVSNNRPGFKERHICGTCARAFKLAIEDQDKEHHEQAQPQPQL